MMKSRLFPEQKQDYPSIPMFKSPVLERLSHIHPSTPFVFWIPVILVLISSALSDQRLTPLEGGLLGLGGLLFWTFAEYALHRFVFHFPAKNRFTQRLVFLTHGVHHDDPNDPTRLVMPLVLSIPLSIPFYLGFRFILGPNHATPFFAGFLAGYLAYDFIHYAVHHFRMQSPLGRRLKEYHMKHHFMHQGGKWGVSSPIWDILFATVNEKHRKDPLC